MEAQTEYSNITKRIKEKIGANLHLKENHPIQILRDHIYKYFSSLEGYEFKTHDEMPQVVSLEDNFDLLRIPPEHPSRRKTDTYYVNEKQVLRTHTSAHQNRLLAEGETSFLVTGDVYRNDEIDRNHYPVFHQMEGVHLVDEKTDPEEDLKRVLTGLVEYLFPGTEYRINGDYFPFTDPSFEIEVKFRGDWLEILGCGVVHPEILAYHKITQKGWAFGLGLERLAMILFSIPDIRYFWSTHPRFLEQFSEGKIVTFKPYSELPTQTNDISFWIPNDQLEITTSESGEKMTHWTSENNMFSLIGDLGGDMVESVKIFDEFTHPKSNRYSRAYRLTFSPVDPELKDPAVFTEQALAILYKVAKMLPDTIGVEIR